MIEASNPVALLMDSVESLTIELTPSSGLLGSSC